MIIKPYLIVPKLIPQPTWGGTYIANFKNLDKTVFSELLIGQSYELATESTLSTVVRSKLLPLELANASDGSVEEVVGDRNTCFSLQDLIKQDPSGVLGERVAELNHNCMQLLIKFTQAKGNSFQVHVRPGVSLGAWKPKPESWYFFQPGKVTLGLKSPIKTTEYRQVCQEIEVKSQELSVKVISGEMQVVAAREELAGFIKNHSPFAFVNELNVTAETVVDLSNGGIHHSWEESSELPNGNIVYEVQVNVMDKECTLRSFDKGKFNDDGSLRPIHIDDYFSALDVDEAHNLPETYMRQPVLTSKSGVDSTSLFDSLYYKSSLISFSKEYTGPETTTNAKESFHHIFVKQGEIELRTSVGTLNVGQGASIFVPASVGLYTLWTSDKAQVIKTWV